MTDNVVENAQASAQSAAVRDEHLSPGAQLREAREAAGLTLDELSARLRMTGNKLELLERDEYDRLPSALYVRGYIRNACKELAVDPEPVLKAFSGYSAAEEESRAIIEHVSKGPVIDEGGKGGHGVLALVALVVVAGAFWWFQGRDLGVSSIDVDSLTAERPVEETVADSTVVDSFAGEFSEPAATAAVAPAEPVTTAAPETFESLSTDEGSGSLESAQQSFATQSEEVAPAPVEPSGETAIEETAAETAVAEEPEPVTATAAGGAALETAVEPVAAEEPAAAPVTTGPVETLELSFAQEAWVEAKDASGSVLLAKLQPEGSVVVLEGQSPFSLMLGNAAATEVRFRGQVIPSDPIGGRRTRRMTVGE